MTPWTFRSYNDWMRIGQQIAPILDGELFQVEVKRFKAKRTLRQNAKIYPMLRDLALFTGYTEQQTHDICVKMFAPIVERQIGDQYVKVHIGTSEMTKEQASEFIERLYQLGSEIGVVWNEPS